MIVEKFTLTTLTKYLNSNFEKKTNKPFTIRDVQGYIKRGYLPLYLHKKQINIQEVKFIPGTRVYQLKIEE